MAVTAMFFATLWYVWKHPIHEIVQHAGIRLWDLLMYNFIAAFSIFPLAAVVVLTLSWARAAMMFGRQSLVLGCRLFRLYGRTWLVLRIHYGPVAFLALGVVSLTAWATTTLNLTLTLAVVCALDVLSFYGLFCVPAAVLFLAGSAEESLVFQSKIKSASLFLRVVSLLDPGVTNSVYLKTSLEVNIFRSRDSAQWREMVAAIASMVPIVIVDARSESPYVAEEVEWMLGPDYISKTIFIVAEDGRSPGLSNVRARQAGIPDEARVLPESAALECLLNAVKSRQNLRAFLGTGFDAR